MPRFSDFTKSHRAGVLLLIYIVVSFILLIFFGQRAIIRPQQAGQAIFSVFQHGISSVGKFFSNTVNSIQELKVLKTEIKELQTKVSDYEIISRDIDALRQENERLREQLELSGKLEYSNISAEIIGKDPSNYFTTLTINKGLKNGIRENMPVIAFMDGYTGLIGKVVEAGYLTSMIRPIFDQASFVAARFQGSRYDGLVEGTGSSGKNLIMRYVNILARDNIKYNDNIVTSGYNSIYPSGIIIGSLKKIIPEQSQTSLLLEIEPVIDFSRLEYVYVLDGGLIETE